MNEVDEYDRFSWNLACVRVLLVVVEDTGHGNVWQTTRLTTSVAKFAETIVHSLAIGSLRSGTAIWRGDLTQ